MDLQAAKTQLEKELEETTEAMKRLSFKCKELTAKIKKLAKLIESTQEILGK